MKAVFSAAAIVVAISLTSGAASAGERTTDAAAGALAGAVVAGPVGLVAGGVIGFTAGPKISCHMGINCRHRHSSRRVGRYDRRN